MRRAKNDVLSGIRLTAELLRTGRIVICESCTALLQEIMDYAWDPDGPDRPIKYGDHAMDDMRYFVQTWLGGSGFAACSVDRSLSNHREWRNLPKR